MLRQQILFTTCIWIIYTLKYNTVFSGHSVFRRVCVHLLVFTASVSTRRTRPPTPTTTVTKTAGLYHIHVAC